jgi:fermentation-respiration switch protein FrsA (DUF1100 family)
VSRADVTFESDGVRCAAWHYRPDAAGPVPCVVMAHGFSAVRDQRLGAFAERFTAAGLACLVFDYRHFGASEGEPRQLLDIKRQLADWQAAIDFARTLEGVDPDCIALWGSSYSGGHVVAAAARDGRVSAVVSQVPFTDSLNAMRAVQRAAGLPAVLRLTGSALRDQLGALLGRAPRYVPAVGPPGSLAAMTEPDADPGFHAMTPPDSTWVNRYTARVSLRSYRPYAQLRKLRCPVLVIVADRDGTTPPEPAVKAAERAPHAELVRYPIGHFDPYVGEWFERAVAEETGFLTRHLLGDRAPAPSPAT